MIPRFLLLALLPLAACESAAHKAQPMIANPASQNCIAHGGQLVIKQSAGGQRGFCALKDGRTLDIGEYYRQTNP